MLICILYNTVNWFHTKNQMTGPILTNEVSKDLPCHWASITNIDHKIVNMAGWQWLLY